MELSAAHALRVIEDNPVPHQQQLERLASGEREGDSSDTLKGVALQLLVPRCIPVRETLEWLTPPKLEFYGGAYQYFLNWKLPEAITVQDLPACLEFLRSKPGCFDALSPYEDFANRVFDLACENLHSPEIADPLIQLWLDRARNYQPLPHESHANPSLSIFGNESRAESFIEAFLNHPQVDVDDRWHMHELFSGIGLEFLLERLPSAPPDRRKNWALAILDAAKPVQRAKHRDLLQSRYDEYAEIREMFPRIRKPGLDVHETIIRLERAGELKLARQQKRNREKLRRIRKARLTGADVFHAGLVQCRTGDAFGWTNISHGVAWDTGSADPVKINVGESDLFRQAPDEDKKAIRDCARQFLLEFHDERIEGSGRTNGTEAAYWAISWLRAEIDDDSKLRQTVSEKWISAVIDAFNNGEEEHQELVSLAYRWNPEASRQWLRTQLDRKLSGDDEGWLLDLRAFESTWDRQLSEELADFLATTDIKPGSMRDGLLHLLKHDTEFAGKLITDRIDTIRTSDSGIDHSVNRAIVAVAWFFAGTELKDSVWPLISGNVESAKRLLLENISEFDRRERESWEHLESRYAANLLHLVFQLFPPKDDPPLNQSSFVTPTDECIRLRKNLIGWLVKKGETLEVQRFLDTLPVAEVDFYSWNLHEAKQNRALLDWSPSRPAEILRLVRIADGSLIRHGYDLLEVVLASLARFQNELQSQHLHRVWDGDTPKHEEFVSKEIADWLASDLPRIAVNREVEVNRMNERVDIRIEAFPTDGDGSSPITLIIEVKRAHNREIPESIRTQLIDKYLLSNRHQKWSHGIYLVAWFRTKGKWDEKQYLKSKTPSAAGKELAKYCKAAERGTEFRIAPFLLDCSYSKRMGEKSKLGAGDTE